MVDQPDTLTLPLRKPLKLGDHTWRALELHEPTAAQWQQWDGLKGVEADIKAVSIVSGVPDVAIKQLGTRDLIKASAFIAGFLSPDLVTGASA